MSDLLTVILPWQPSTHHVTHVYHTADPIAMGTCTGIFSSCSLGGYAMETKYDQYCTTLSLAVLSTHYRCHLGKSIVYDTVSNLSWSVDVRTHGIVNVIDNILGKPWPPADEVGREVPEPQLEVDCVVSLLCLSLSSQ